MAYETGSNLFPKDAKGEFIDGKVDYVDTWRAMEELVDAGLTRSIGVSNFNAGQIDRLVANGNASDAILTFSSSQRCARYAIRRSFEASFGINFNKNIAY